jgi:hypothetical protein
MARTQSRAVRIVTLATTFPLTRTRECAHEYRE